MLGLLGVDAEGRPVLLGTLLGGLRIVSAEEVFSRDDPELRGGGCMFALEDVSLASSSTTISSGSVSRSADVALALPACFVQVSVIKSFHFNTYL